MNIPNWINNLSKQAEGENTTKLEIIMDKARPYIKDKLVNWPSELPYDSWVSTIYGFIATLKMRGEIDATHEEIEEVSQLLAAEFIDTDGKQSSQQISQLTPLMERELPRVRETVQTWFEEGKSREEIFQELPEYFSMLSEEDSKQLLNIVWPEGETIQEDV